MKRIFRHVFKIFDGYESYIYPIIIDIYYTK